MKKYDIIHIERERDIYIYIFIYFKKLLYYCNPKGLYNESNYMLMMILIYNFKCFNR